MSRLPVDESTGRVRIEEGEYRATCTAVHPPAIFRGFGRVFRRVDFAIHDDGSIVSKYVNMASGDKINIRSEYYKLWVATMGRRHEPGELLDLDVMVGKEFVVTVKDKVHKEVGDTYSVVTTLRLFAQGSVFNVLSSPLSLHGSAIGTPVSALGTPVSALGTPVSALPTQGAQHSALPTQGQPAPRRRKPGLPPDVSALVLTSGDAQGR
jgi:hypothetical protein